MGHSVGLLDDSSSSIRFVRSLISMILAWFAKAVINMLPMSGVILPPKVADIALLPLAARSPPIGMAIVRDCGFTAGYLRVS